MFNRDGHLSLFWIRRAPSTLEFRANLSPLQRKPRASPYFQILLIGQVVFLVDFKSWRAILGNFIHPPSSPSKRCSITQRILDKKSKNYICVYFDLHFSKILEKTRLYYFLLSFQSKLVSKNSSTIYFHSTRNLHQQYHFCLCHRSLLHLQRLY